MFIIVNNSMAAGLCAILIAYNCGQLTVGDVRVGLPAPALCREQVGQACLLANPHGHSL